MGGRGPTVGFLSMERMGRVCRLMEARVVKLGGLSQANVGQVLGYTELRKLVRGWKVEGAWERYRQMAAEVAWAWVLVREEEMKARGEHQGVERMLPGVGGSVMPMWRERARGLWTACALFPPSCRNVLAYVLIH